MYPFYFYQQGVVQRIRKLVKLESSAEAILEKSTSKNSTDTVEPFASEIRLWIDRAREYQDNLKSLVQSTSIVRKQAEVLESHLKKTTQYPTVVRFPQLVPMGEMPDDFVVDWASEEFVSEKSLRNFIETLKSSNADRFKQVGRGSHKEFWYMASRHHEQAMLLYQLDIFRTEVVKFSVKAQSDRLKRMSHEVEQLLARSDVQPPKDYKLGFLRQVTLSEFGYYFGKLREMDDMGAEATLDLKLNDIIDLGVNPVLLSPQRKVLRYLMASSPAIVFSGVAYWWGDDVRDVLKAKMLKFQSEEELVQRLSKIENDVEFMDEFSKVVRARFDGTEDELGMIRFEDEEAAAEFSKKVRAERMKYLGMRLKSKIKEHEILFGPKTDFPAPEDSE